MEGGARYDRAITELRLGPPGKDEPEAAEQEHRPLKRKEPAGDRREEAAAAAPVAKAAIVGWPPVRAHRMNSFRSRKAEAEGGDSNAAAVYVKVGMDGAPYLRKVDLKVYEGYKELRGALGDMFKCFSLGAAEGYDRSEYAVAYEDRDGDWMLVGDVPWEMFISSCKRLRIMKGSEARGLTSNP